MVLSLTSTDPLDLVTDIYRLLGSNDSIRIWAETGCLGVLGKKDYGLCQSEGGKTRRRTAIMKHFELQGHTQIPASDLDRAGTRKVLSRPNESQCEGVLFRKHFFFLISQSDSEV